VDRYLRKLLNQKIGEISILEETFYLRARDLVYGLYSRNELSICKIANLSLLLSRSIGSIMRNYITQKPWTIES
jgi:hypothetical protein